MSAFKSIAEYVNLQPKQFFEYVANEQRPVVIRGFARHWPMVAHAQNSAEAFVRYLVGFYHGRKTKMVVAPPAANKRFYYNEDMTDVNYLSGEERVDLFLGRLLELVDASVYPAIAMQSTLINDILPGLTDDNPCTFFKDTPPRLWVGNEGVVNTHFDGSDNMACVVAGRRRFVLFPPSESAHLYPGPLNFTPAGAPTSLVDLNAPDFEKYPLFKHALANAYSAELGPGDAIFIPMLWWHHVESLDKVNALVNYWWNGSSAPNASPPSAIDSLNIALLAMRDLSPKQREAWRYLFDHYLFKQGVDPASYIPEHQLHVLGQMSPEYIAAVKAYFVRKWQQ
ncbi:cupin-like domain-containing protein [Glaciecola siphonariae]|uniref:Cupin-like domain-containing protein n=1 Tax=Glaciecola siphonariae TaxID=521012 RepID=A0ABV9M1G8_9ALTE